MGFCIDINTKEPDEGNELANQEIVACDCWFSSSGNTIPRFIKYKDNIGEIHMIKDIFVHRKFQNRYCGITVWRYDCSANDDRKRKEFVLLFNIEECKWKIIWRKAD